MDADDLRVAGEFNLETIIEIVSRFGAVVFLFLIIVLLLRARRRSKGDIWIGLVFGSWMLAILYSAIRWLLGKPPTTFPSAFYVVVFVLEIIAAFHMIRESNRTLSMRRERDRNRDLFRDQKRDLQRDIDRDVGRDSTRDIVRDAADVSER
jgi:hypothetical protein